MFTPKSIHFCTSEQKKSEGRYCCAYSCKNNPCSKKRGLCHKHYHTYRRQINPVYDRYVNFKGNALKRGISFIITLEEFRKYCNDTGYIIKKGMRGRNCTVDRIINYEGYYIGNIQLLTLWKNIEKYHTVDKLHEDYVPF